MIYRDTNVASGFAAGTARTEPARQTTVDLAAQAVRNGIAHGKYVPGQRLVEVDLMRELSVSRGVVRETLRRLAADGLVSIEPYRGAVVERLTRERLEAFFELTEALEGLAARRAAENFAHFGRAAKEIARKLREYAVHPKDRNAFIESNICFHSFVVELSGNVLLPKTLTQLQTPALRIHFPNLLDDREIVESTEQHLAIVDAICAANAGAAEKIMREHVRRTAVIARRMPDFLFSRPESRVGAKAHG